MTKEEKQKDQADFRTESERTGHYVRLISSLMATFSDPYYAILDSGYAVEALTGGTITRFHDDLDLMVVAPPIDTELFKKRVIDHVNDVDSIEWVSLPTKGHWIWLREKDYENFPTPYQINIHLLISNQKTDTGGFFISSQPSYILPIEQHVLTDSVGKVFNVFSPSLDYMVATKIRLIEPYGNNPRFKDIFDLKKMMLHSSFSEAQCLIFLQTFYTARLQISIEDARTKAMDQLNTVNERIQFDETMSSSTLNSGE